MYSHETKPDYLGVRLPCFILPSIELLRSTSPARYMAERYLPPRVTLTYVFYS